MTSRNLSASLLGALASSIAVCEQQTDSDLAVLLREIQVPIAFQAIGPDGRYGGDIRIGDLSGNGQPEFVVYRCADAEENEDALKPCFMAAFDADGKPLWSIGSGGAQPARPGPVTLYDLDGDGDDEIVCFFFDESSDPDSGSLNGIELQIRDGATGELQRATAPPTVLAQVGEGPNWVHQRFLVANLRGKERPQDFVIKLGAKVFALDERLEILWEYEAPWTEYQKCPAYIPAVGDIDGDGRDEINGGYYLLDDDGRVLWEGFKGPNMDSVAIAPWDGGRMRAVCSGSGQVFDAAGNTLLNLGEEQVPHGQELRVARFDPDVPGAQMMIRYRGHKPDVLLADENGNVVRQFRLNDSPNHTGMESVYWYGQDKPALLFNGGQLWTGKGFLFSELPSLRPPQGHSRQGWYHCVPADLTDDDREEIVVYNPWEDSLYLYGSEELPSGASLSYEPTARQYNARLLD